MRETIEQEAERVFGSCGGKCGEAPCIAWNEKHRNEYETFVKLILPEAVRKISEEGFGNYLVYANGHTEWPLVDEFSDVTWLDAACALGYPVPEEEEEDE